MPLRKSATIVIEDGPVSPRLGQATLARAIRRARSTGHDSPRTHTKMWLERPPIRERYSSGSRFPSITLACTVTARPQPEITKWAVAVLSLNQVVPLPHKCVAFGIRESV
jgi:hypothetical protein